MEAKTKETLGVTLSGIMIAGAISLWLVLLMAVPHVTILLTVASIIYSNTCHGKANGKRYLCNVIRGVGVFLGITLATSVAVVLVTNWYITIPIGILGFIVYKVS